MRQAAAKGVDFGTAPTARRHGLSKATMGVADWMMAFKENGHRAQIGKFLDFVYSEKNVLEVLRRYDLLPVTNSASEAMRRDRRYAGCTASSTAARQRRVLPGRQDLLGAGLQDRQDRDRRRGGPARRPGRRAEPTCRTTADAADNTGE